ncbi:unnamed protein product [Caenorhabditis angaria]|uniref:Uncharacterized protein n=1 Tax=Caenorhabditis angaria TaxID=860376 RepID=A0A9P1MST6_9PELO|nr:unnamed protein product [Caenorhabditis angaria]
MIKNLFDFICTGRIRRRRFVEPTKEESESGDYVVQSTNDKPLEEAIKEDRYTPIDFNTIEVKHDSDVENSPNSSNISVVSLTPSPIPETYREYIPRPASMSFRKKSANQLGSRRVASVNRVVDMKQPSHRRSFHNPSGSHNNPFAFADFQTTSTPKVLAVRPLRNHSEDFESDKILVLEKRIRELELSRIDATSPRFSKGHRREAMEITDELLRKDMKVKKLETKLLKAYQKMEKLNDDNQEMMHNVTAERNEAKIELQKCLERMEHLENELDYTRDSLQNETTRQLNETIWKQDRELRESRKIQNKLKEKENECEEMKIYIAEIESKKDELIRKIEEIQKNQKMNQTVVLRRSNYGQSCSSTSTPVSEDNDILKMRGSTQLIRNVHKDGDITPFMSRSIRDQTRLIATCRAMVICMKNGLEKMENGEHLNFRTMFGDDIMSELTDESFEEEAEDSTPFSMFAAENKLSKQCQDLTELDNQLNLMRQKIIAFNTNEIRNFTEGDRETCRLQ